MHHGLLYILNIAYRDVIWADSITLFNIKQTTVFAWGTSVLYRAIIISMTDHCTQLEIASVESSFLLFSFKKHTAWMRFYMFELRHKLMNWKEEHKVIKLGQFPKNPSSHRLLDYNGDIQQSCLAASEMKMLGTKGKVRFSYCKIFQKVFKGCKWWRKFNTWEKTNQKLELVKWTSCSPEQWCSLARNTAEGKIWGIFNNMAKLIYWETGDMIL